MDAATLHFCLHEAWPAACPPSGQLGNNFFPKNMFSKMSSTLTQPFHSQLAQLYRSFWSLPKKEMKIF